MQKNSQKHFNLYLLVVLCEFNVSRFVPKFSFRYIYIFPPLQAAILQQTADYIFTLEQEKTQLLAQNNQLKRFIQVAACVPVFHHKFASKIGLNKWKCRTDHTPHTSADSSFESQHTNPYGVGFFPGSDTTFRGELITVELRLLSVTALSGLEYS